MKKEGQISMSDIDPKIIQRFVDKSRDEITGFKTHFREDEIDYNGDFMYDCESQVNRFVNLLGLFISQKIAPTLTENSVYQNVVFMNGPARELYRQIGITPRNPNTQVLTEEEWISHSKDQYSKTDRYPRTAIIDTNMIYGRRLQYLVSQAAQPLNLINKQTIRNFTSSLDIGIFSRFDSPTILTQELNLMEMMYLPRGSRKQFNWISLQFSQFLNPESTDLPTDISPKAEDIAMSLAVENQKAIETKFKPYKETLDKPHDYIIKKTADELLEGYDEKTKNDILQSLMKLVDHGLLVYDGTHFGPNDLTFSIYPRRLGPYFHTFSDLVWYCEINDYEYIREIDPFIEKILKNTEIQEESKTLGIDPNRMIEIMQKTTKFIKHPKLFVPTMCWLSITEQTKEEQALERKIRRLAF